MTKIDKIKEFFNCYYADIDNDGDIWIEIPMRGHWLNDEEKQAFEAFCQREGNEK